MAKAPEEWHLTLNRYQRDNLLWLINAIGWPSPEAATVEPFHLAHTGDWVGEIGWMLAEPGKSPVLDERARPNIAPEELRERVAAWLEAAIQGVE